MEFQNFFIEATITLGFIVLCKSMFHFLKWIWVWFLRQRKDLKEYGSWAIITGSTDGIGKGIALEFASKGLNIVLVGRNPLKLEATSKEIKDRNKVEVKCVVIDMENISGEEIMKRVKEVINGLDVGILVNCAGVSYPYAKYFHEVDLDWMNAIIKVNMEALTWVTKAVIPSMVKKKKGAIINIGSGSCHDIPSFPLFSLYAASKVYVEMFSRCINLEYKHQGIDVQCQVPYFVSTKLTKRKPSLFVPTPEIYSEACTKWIGYEKMVVPYFFHNLQSTLISLIPEVIMDSFMLRYFINNRQRGLLKESQNRR